MAEPTTLVEYYASRGLSDPKRRVDLNERLDEADAAAVDALGAYKEALAIQLEGSPGGTSGSLDIEATASRASASVRALESLHREVRGFLANAGGASATVTIPAEFRERFVGEVPWAVKCLKDPENEYTDADRRQADELVEQIAADPTGELTVPASSAALVAILGCVARTSEEINSEAAPNDPEVRREAEKAMADLHRWYSIAAEFPEEVRG